MYRWEMEGASDRPYIGAPFIPMCMKLHMLAKRHPIGVAKFRQIGRSATDIRYVYDNETFYSAVTYLQDINELSNSTFASTENVH